MDMAENLIATVAIDKSGSNLAALDAVNADRETPIMVR